MSTGGRCKGNHQCSIGIFTQLTAGDIEKANQIDFKFEFSVSFQNIPIIYPSFFCLARLPFTVVYDIQS